jgi:TonB family protein
MKSFTSIVLPAFKQFSCLKKRNIVRSEAILVVAKLMFIVYCLAVLITVPSFSQETGKRLSFGMKPDDFDKVQKATDTPARLKQPLDVSYPELAFRNKREGIVIVNTAIDADGNVVFGEVETSSGSRTLDSAALAAVKDGYFLAAQRDGKRVAARLTIPVEFRLDPNNTNVDATEEELQREKNDLVKQKNAIEEEQRKLQEELQRLKDAQKKKLS